MLKDDFPFDAKSKIILFLLENDVSKKTDLLHITTMHTIEKSLRELESDEYIQINEIFQGRRTYIITLTRRGKTLAIQLRKAQEVAEGKNIEKSSPVEDNSKRIKNIKTVYDADPLKWHASVEETSPDQEIKVLNISIKKDRNGYFRLWCESDRSFNCYHVKTCWTYPQVQEMMMKYKGEVKVCQICGYENPENAVYCMKCGKNIE